MKPNNRPSGFWLLIMIVLIYSFCVGKIAIAEPVPAFDISSILANTDLVANVEPIQPLGKCRVLTVLAGRDVNSGSTITISTQDQSLLAALKDKQRICVFLKHLPNGQVEFESSNSYYSWFRIGSNAVRAKSLGRDAIEAQLLADLSSTNEAVVNDAIVWLTYLQSIKGEQAISDLSKAAHPSTSVYASYLVQQMPKGNREVLQEAQDFIRTSKNISSATKWVWNVEYAFASIRSTNDVSYLNHLLVSGEAGTSRWLAYSARYWGNKTSVPYLISALTQSNIQRQTLVGRSNTESDEIDQAVEKEENYISALSTITKRPSVGLNDFRKSPDKYYANWQEWWKGIGRIEYGEIATN